MPLIASSYQRPAYLLNKHFETIFPALFRKVQDIEYQRERITIFDGDFLDLDWVYHTDHPSRLAIISHGLEGDTHKAYIKAMAKIFHRHQWDVVAWNHRGCSGELNRLQRFYHSGSSEDLAAVVTHVLGLQKYREIVLVGFSLGGNMTLKYLGEQGKDIDPTLKKAVTFSVPLHLSSCSASLHQAKNFIYAHRFKKSLKNKIRRKARVMPEAIDDSHLPKIKKLIDFDNFYTAPLHGFKDAEDYYQKSSAVFFVDKISIPTLIVNAQNDPFFAPECYPYKKLEKLKNVFFETPRTGGHCGFASFDKEGFFWSERRAIEFVENTIQSK